MILGARGAGWGFRTCKTNKKERREVEERKNRKERGREAGPPNDLNDEVDSDEQVANKEFSLSRGYGAPAPGGAALAPSNNPGRSPACGCRN